MLQLTTFKRKSLFGYTETVSVYLLEDCAYHIYQEKGPMDHGFFNVFPEDDRYERLLLSRLKDDECDFDLEVDAIINESEREVLALMEVLA